MAARQRHSWWGLAVVIALATACSNSTGPQAHLASPQQLSSDLQAVSGVFQSTAFQGFGAIGTATGSPATVTTPAGALLQAVPITAPRTSSQPYADAPRRLQALRLAASTLHTGISASVVPPSLRLPPTGSESSCTRSTPSPGGPPRTRSRPSALRTWWMKAPPRRRSTSST